MLEKTNVHKRVNLGARPDHYALQRHGDKLEVIETVKQPDAHTVFLALAEADRGARDASLSLPRRCRQSSWIMVARIGGNYYRLWHRKGPGSPILRRFPAFCPDSLCQRTPVPSSCRMVKVDSLVQSSTKNEFPFLWLKKQPTAILKKRPQQGCFHLDF